MIPRTRGGRNRVGINLSASVLIAVVALIALSVSAEISSANAQSTAKELPPAAKLVRLIDHKQFEQQFNTCAKAAPRCASLLQAIESGTIAFIPPVTTDAKAKAALERMCGSKYLGGPMRNPNGGWPSGQIVPAKGPVTLYRLTDVANKVPGHGIYLVRTEDYFYQHGERAYDGELDSFSMPGCRRVGAQSFLTSGGTIRPVDRNDWMAEPIVINNENFLLEVYKSYDNRNVYLTLLPAVVPPGGNPAEHYTFRSN